MEGLLGYAASWLVIIGGLWTLFSKIAEVTNEDFNSRVTHWIQGVSFNSRSSDSKRIIYLMFQKFFGTRHFSMKCFFRSLLYSVFVFLIVVMVTGIGSDLFGYFKLGLTDSYYDALCYALRHEIFTVVLIAFCLLLMIIQDFFSLYVTRILLKKIAESNIRYMVLILAIHFVLLTIVSIFVASLLGFIIKFSDSFSFREGLFGIPDYLSISYFTDPNIPLGEELAFISTVYLGIFWVFLIQLARLFTKLFSWLFKSFDFVRSIIDVEKKPIQSLGAISVLVVTVGYLIGLPFILFG